MAVWKEMISDSRYEVSDAGEVRRKDTQKIRRPSITPAGYRVIVMSTPGGKHKGVYVHREVLRAFVGECPDHCEVSHLNGNNADNRLANLAYETRSSNQRRKKAHGTLLYGEKHPSSKLNEDGAREIRRLSAEGYSAAKIAARVGLSKSQVNRVLRREHWAHV
jgi:hypothetical protein